MDFITIKREVKALDAFLTSLNLNNKKALVCYHGNYSEQDFSIYTRETKFQLTDKEPTTFKMKEVQGIKFKIYDDVPVSVSKKLIKAVVERV